MTRHFAEQAPQIIEDAEFIADNYGGLTEAARRLGFNTPAALEKYLTREGRKDLVRRLHHYDPIPDGVLNEPWKGAA